MKKGRMAHRVRPEVSMRCSARTHSIGKPGLPQANGIAIRQDMTLHALTVDKGAVARADIFEDVLCSFTFHDGMTARYLFIIHDNVVFGRAPQVQCLSLQGQLGSITPH